MISIAGFMDFAATAIPAISPPPPTGTTRQSKPASPSNISIATVPCPAITSASS